MIHHTSYIPLSSCTRSVVNILSKLTAIASGKNLSLGEAETIIKHILRNELPHNVVISILTALRAKGESAEEIAGFAKVIRLHMKRLELEQEEDIIDTCGTGGDMKGTFNVSTACMFVLAGAGAKVAKHGNRSISSKCGSADVLEELGVYIEMSPSQARRCLHRCGVTFLYAPLYHPVMKSIMPIRKQLGVGTIFNLVGPLCNPAGVRCQILGVPNRMYVRPILKAFVMLGGKRGMVVCGEDGVDEITTAGPTFIAEYSDGSFNEYEITPRDFGFQMYSLSSVKGGSKEENANIIKQVLMGKGGAERVIVLLNAGAALYIAGMARTIEDGIDLAAASIDKGKALDVLHKMVKFSEGINKGAFLS